jgi:2-keto-4-pentenoate hydratase/2-oxohepta-3-ene-1,7-dioic acid hydratase in catechol pathway
MKLVTFKVSGSAGAQRRPGALRAPFPYYSDKLDLELEIGIVVGRGGDWPAAGAARVERRIKALSRQASLERP